MRRVCNDFRPVRNMWPRLALGRRKQGRMRMKSREWWALCDSTSLSEAHRYVT